MKLLCVRVVPFYNRMPPTRGHDLKHIRKLEEGRMHKMPPTRGHDLKLLNRSFAIDFI